MHDGGNPEMFAPKAQAGLALKRRRRTEAAFPLQRPRLWFRILGRSLRGNTSAAKASSPAAPASLASAAATSTSTAALGSCWGTRTVADRSPLCAISLASGRTLRWTLAICLCENRFDFIALLIELGCLNVRLGVLQCLVCACGVQRRGIAGNPEAVVILTEVVHPIIAHGVPRSLSADRAEA